jgi:hypothetical protein
MVVTAGVTAQDSKGGIDATALLWVESTFPRMDDNVAYFGFGFFEGHFSERFVRPYLGRLR